ncbi:hypothetical protein AMECASPLE_033998 [Ameca splendens]|uniref:Uncharacterized protein n=1 Tax=Ameca splendens TaxID=208324 RepID=A0ABV0ZGX2_9TELE
MTQEKMSDEAAPERGGATDHTLTCLSTLQRHPLHHTSPGDKDTAFLSHQTPPTVNLRFCGFAHLSIFTHNQHVQSDSHR